jgi:NitT/TauT family transport system substrate-binding protein
MEPKLKDPAFVAKMAKFVQASEKGWDWAKKNDKEAAKIVIAADTTGAQTLHHQEQMMTEIAKLLGNDNGKLDFKDADHTVAELLSGGSDPVITKKPEGAWTHAVYDAMK